MKQDTGNIEQYVNLIKPLLPESVPLPKGYGGFNLRKIFTPTEWCEETEIDTAGLSLLGEDDCGNSVVISANGDIKFWDHEDDKLVPVARSISKLYDMISRASNRRKARGLDEPRNFESLSVPELVKLAGSVELLTEATPEGWNLCEISSMYNRVDLLEVAITNHVAPGRSFMCAVNNGSAEALQMLIDRGYIELPSRDSIEAEQKIAYEFGEYTGSYIKVADILGKLLEGMK